ncbi:MAG: hypothetical protein WA459_13765 [Stellaceae bacterium]
MFDRLRLGHFIGGNGRAEAGEIVRTKRFIPRPSVAPPLSNDETATVLAHEPSQSLFQRLEDQYRRDFGDLSSAT